MAKRPIFVPQLSSDLLVKPILIDFSWFPGMAASQKQRSIQSLHASAADHGFNRVLEISSKSLDELGIQLSAFNLAVNYAGIRTSVECLFQGSKAFKNGGPYTDLYKSSSLEAKRDERLRNSGDLVNFQLGNDIWLLEPKTAFYDWIYLNALRQNKELAKQLLEYDAFSDIEFNPEKSINCQAYGAALFVSLTKQDLIEKALTSKEEYKDIIMMKKFAITNTSSLQTKLDL